MQKITEKTFEVEISAENVPVGLEVEYEKNVPVLIKCGENVLPQDIRAVINLKDLNEGEHYVKLQVMGDVVISAEEKNVLVKLTK